MRWTAPGFRVGVWGGHISYNCLAEHAHTVNTYLEVSESLCVISPGRKLPTRVCMCVCVVCVCGVCVCGVCVCVGFNRWTGRSSRGRIPPGRAACPHTSRPRSCSSRRSHHPPGTPGHLAYLCQTGTAPPLGQERNYSQTYMICTQSSSPVRFLF